MSKTRIVRYVCKYCQQSYKLPTGLIQHKKQEHPEEVAKILASFRAEREKRTEEKENNNVDIFETDVPSQSKNEGDEGMTRLKNSASITPDDEDETPSISTHTDKKMSSSTRNPFECRICKKVLRRIAERINHERAHSGQRPYKCKTCRKSFVWKCSLSRHLKKSSSCTSSASTGNTKKEKKIEQLEPPSTPKTKKSKVIKLKKQVVKATTVRNPGPLPPNSSSPSKIRRKPASPTVRYTEFQLSTGLIFYKCIFCLKESSTLPDAVRHGSTHRSTEPVRCTYPNCSAIFIRTISLESHIGRCHTGELPFECNYCRLRYPTLTDYRRHQKRSMKCIKAKIDCLKSDMVKSAVKEEAQKVQPKKSPSRKPVKNNKASAIVVSSKPRRIVPKKRRAISSTSTKAKTFVRTTEIQNGKLVTVLSCKLCTAEFRGRHGSSMATRHSWSHTKPFRCSYCNKAFGRKENQFSHEAIHTGELPFACDGCGKSFRWRSAARTCSRSHLSNEIESHSTIQQEMSE